jgi:hypothetical protein
VREPDYDYYDDHDDGVSPRLGPVGWRPLSGIKALEE